MTILADSVARERAATVMDRNLVVSAGAGTGKTTLLIDRLTHLLFRQPHPLAIGEIVALTFTNKAANEMKLRLRERLGLWLSLDPGIPPTGASRRREWEQLADVLARYELSKTRLNELAGQALRELEKSQIGTIHSFAAHLLRLYPRECGVDPAFIEDDGTQFKDHMEREWTVWLDEELGPDGKRHDVWRQALGILRLDEIKSLATQLCSELIPLDAIRPRRECDAATVPPSIKTWLDALAARTTRLHRGRPKSTIIERMLEAADEFLTSFATGQGRSRSERSGWEFDRKVPPMTTTWTREDYEQAKSVLRITRALLYVDAGPLKVLLPCVIDFAEACRRRFIERGLVSFDGLLARSRNLLRDYPAIRRGLKAQFRAFLVDEFQDTDPVQYELILYLAEIEHEEASRWQDLSLTPGKLFIVGDPKQSIYAFRRADMEAYDAVVEDRVLVQGDRQTLQTNFRSHAGLLSPINACFSRLFPSAAVKGLYPKDEPLIPSASAHSPLKHEGVEIRLVRPRTEEADADTATRCEAEALARWLREDVFDRQSLHEGDLTVTVKPRHVAILFRTLTHARDYLEALRRYDIPYLTEGEKHFYARQEIIDVVNLLRATADPHDQMALAGVLRSPLGGLTDRELERLARSKKLDFRLDPSKEVHAAVAIYDLLRTLHVTLPKLTVAEAMEEVFARAPVMELAAASLDGEQAVANLRKLRTLVVELAAGAEVTWQGLIRTLTDRIAEVPDEAESPLAEEGPEDLNRDGAVRVLSIHKAKGLEFPMVILAGLHRGKDGSRDRVFVKHDWATDLVGIRAGDAQTLAGIYIDAKLAEREQAEQRRVLYVGMTRARRRLILSAGVPSRMNRFSDSFLSLLNQGFCMDLLEESGGTVKAGEREIPLVVVPGEEIPLTRSGHQSRWTESAHDLSSQQTVWETRAARWQRAIAESMFRTPAKMMEELPVDSRPMRSRREDEDPEASRQLGVLVHRVLEPWEFAGDPNQLDAHLTFLGGKAAPEVCKEVRNILSVFLTSESYDQLRRARILGREVPFIMPWQGERCEARGERSETSGFPRASSPEPRAYPCVMEGVIDLLYELDGEIWIADYKTDRMTEEEVARKVEQYRPQVKIYARAAAKALDIEHVRAQLIFLRLGRAVEV